MTKYCEDILRRPVLISIYERLLLIFQGNVEKAGFQQWINVSGKGACGASGPAFSFLWLIRRVRRASVGGGGGCGCSGPVWGGGGAGGILGGGLGRSCGCFHPEPCGAAFSGGLGIGAFRTVWVLVGYVQSRELGTCAPRLPRFFLLVSFRDTLLVVSIIDIVYDFHWRSLL